MAIIKKYNPNTGQYEYEPIKQSDTKRLNTLQRLELLEEQQRLTEAKFNELSKAKTLTEVINILSI